MRGAVARQQGFDARRAEAVQEHADSLDERTSAALRLADLMMTQPNEIDEQFAAELHALFEADELFELTVDIMKWNYQKVAVALGTDVEVAPGEIVDLEFDADGNWIRPG